MKLNFALLFVIGTLSQAFSEQPSVVDIPALVEKTGGAEVSAADWVNLGNALMQEARDRGGHKFNRAEDAFRKALELNPKSTDAMLGMAWVKNSEHLFVQGQGWAEKALSHDPALVDAHALLGDYAMETGEYDVAFEHFQTAIDLRADLSTYSRAGHLLWLTGDTVRSQELMVKAIAAGGPYAENVAWCRTELSRMLFNIGAMLPAEMQIDEALKLAPENARALAMKGKILAANGHMDGASTAYEKSASITPNHQALAGLVKLHDISRE